MQNINTADTRTLESLRIHMGSYSNEIIDNILTLEKDVNLWMTEEITEIIKWHIISFLEQKAAITYEYAEGDANGDTYHFENRKKYRENIGKVIELVIKRQDMVEKKNNQVQIIEDNLTKVLVENNK